MGHYGYHVENFFLLMTTNHCRQPSGVILMMSTCHSETNHNPNALLNNQISLQFLWTKLGKMYNEELDAKRLDKKY